MKLHKFMNWKSFFQKSKNFINIGSRNNEIEDMNLVNMILSLESNISNKVKKISLLYDTYINSQEMQYNDDFRNSLKVSKKCIQNIGIYKKSILNLKLNDPDSFIVLPLVGERHLFSVVIRKIDEGYSAIIVNKGLRFWHDPVEEFVFNHDNIKNLTLALSFSTINSFYYESIEDIYRSFINSADFKYNLKINTSPQKVGNCFTKNIQAGFKMAQGLRDVSNDEFKKLRFDSYSSYGTPDKDKVTFKWKGKTTEEVNKLVGEKIAHSNPRVKDSVKKSIKKYITNKLFRNYLKNNKSPVSSLLDAFDSKTNPSPLPQDDKLKLFISKITAYNYNVFKEKIDQIVEQIKDQDYVNMYKELDGFSEISKYYKTNMYLPFFMEARHDPVKSLQTIFDKKDTLKNLSPAERNKIFLSKLSSRNVSCYRSRIIQVLHTIYSPDKVMDEYDKLQQEAVAQSRSIKIKTHEAIVRLRQLEPHFPMIVNDLKSSMSSYYLETAEFLLTSNTSLEEALEHSNTAILLDKNPKGYLLRGLCHYNMNQYEKAVNDLSQAIKLNPKNEIAYALRSKVYSVLKNPIASAVDSKIAKKFNTTKEFTIFIDRLIQRDNSLLPENNIPKKDMQL